MKSGVYQIINEINGARYIGSTINLCKRKSNHFYDLKKGTHRNKWLQSAFNEYGAQGLHFQILLYCKKEDLKFYEQRAIDAFNIDLELYNIEPSAMGSVGVIRTDEHRKKMSEIKKKCSEETRAKLRTCNLGRKQSEETKIKRSISLKETYSSGKRVISERQREIMSKTHKGKAAPKLDKSPSAKAILQFDNSGRFVREWGSLTEASLCCGVSISKISTVCKGKRTLAGGFIWKYKKRVTS